MDTSFPGVSKRLGRRKGGRGYLDRNKMKSPMVPTILVRSTYTESNNHRVGPVIIEDWELYNE